MKAIELLDADTAVIATTHEGRPDFVCVVTEATREHERECAADQVNVPSPFGMTRWSKLARELVRLRSENPSTVSIY